MIYICPKCGSENLDNASFCSVCGAALDEAGDVRRRVPRDHGDQMCFGPSGGALPGLVIGAIIIIVGVASVFGGNFGVMMGMWGEGRGRWGEGVGRFFADWGTGWGSKIGASFSIILGLAILYFIMYGRDR